MKSDSGIKGKGSKKFFDQPQIEGSRGVLFETNTICEKWPVGDVHCDPNQRFIHGNGCFPVTPYSLFFPQRLFEGQTEADSQIFNRVVVVNLRIPPTL